MSSNGIALLTPQEQLQSRLADPKTVDSLNRLLDQVDLIAFSFEALDGFLRRSEVVAASLTASVAELRGLSPVGSGLVDRLPQLARAGVQLADTTEKPEFQNLVNSGLIEQLGNPRTIETLKLLLSKLDLVTFAVQSVDGFLRRGDEVADSVASSVAELRKFAPSENTSEFVGKLPQLASLGLQLADTAAKPELQNLLNSGILEQLGNPKTIDSLQRLLSKLDLAVFALEAADGFLRRGDEIADSVASGLGELTNIDTGIDLEKVKTLAAQLPGLIDTGASLVEAGMPEKLARLSDVGIKLANAGMFDQRVLDVLSEVGQSVAESYAAMKLEPPRPLGIFGLMGALKDPNVSKTLSFLLEVAKRYSQKMK